MTGASVHAATLALHNCRRNGVYGTRGECLVSCDQQNAHALTTWLWCKARGTAPPRIVYTGSSAHDPTAASAKQPRGTTRVVLWHKGKRSACFSVHCGRSRFERACSSSPRALETELPQGRASANRETVCEAASRLTKNGSETISSIHQ